MSSFFLLHHCWQFAYGIENSMFWKGSKLIVQTHWNPCLNVFLQKWGVVTIQYIPLPSFLISQSTPSPVTNEVQSGTITFLNTTVSLRCEFTATGSASGCRFTLTLASGDSESLDIPRPEGGGLVQMCSTTQNNRFIPLFFFLSPSFPFSFPFSLHWRTL